MGIKNHNRACLFTIIKNDLRNLFLKQDVDSRAAVSYHCFEVLDKKDIKISSEKNTKLGSSRAFTIFFQF